MISTKTKSLPSFSGRETRDSTQIHISVAGHTFVSSIKPPLCIGSSRENLLAFSLPNSEMHFTTLSVSASTLRTRSAVFSLATLFFIVFY